MTWGDNCSILKTKIEDKWTVGRNRHPFGDERRSIEYAGRTANGIGKNYPIATGFPARFLGWSEGFDSSVNRENCASRNANHKLR